MEEWCLDLEIGKPVFTSYELPTDAEGVGMTEAMRGGLGHWMRVRSGRISHYQIITRLLGIAHPEMTKELEALLKKP